MDMENCSPRKKSLSKAFSLRIFSALSSGSSPQNTQRGEAATKELGAKAQRKSKRISQTP
jgi:hypothetical protein